MGAAFSDDAVLEVDDAVGLFDSGQTVGDDNDRPVFHQVIDGLLDLAFRLHVHGGGGFVQDEDGRVTQDRPGNGEPLLLAAGEPDPPFADVTVVTVGHGHDEVVGISRPAAASISAMVAFLLL